MQLPYYVYLLANRKDGTLYLSVTSNIVRRVYEHKQRLALVRFECHDDPMAAITREKDIKKWRRAWKICLIEADNPGWLDRYESVAH
jgi:putative endonuclease